jgi:hypothetical protein
MKVLYLILFIIAAVCFAFAALAGDRVPPRVNLIALGLLSWVLVLVIQTARSLD